MPTMNSYRYVIFKRIREKDGKREDFWQNITGGHMEGETLEETMFREVYEESGIEKNKIKSVIKGFHDFEWHAPDLINKNDIRYVKEYCFGIKVESNTPIILSKEHSEHKVVYMNNALELIKYDSNKDAIRKLSALLKE